MNTPSPIPMDPLCEALLAHCARMARVAPTARDVAGVEPTPAELDAAAARHGLTRGTEDHGLCRQTRQGGKNLLAIHQLQEIAAAFAREEIRVIALKGAAALLTLYDEGEVREMLDLDLLVEFSSIARVREAMSRLGYSPAPNRSDLREEELLLHRSHLRPYRKPHRLSVEIHVDLLQGLGRDPRAAGEVWRAARSVACGSAPIGCLAPTHFFIHTALHFTKDLETGTASLKGIVDLLVLLRREPDAIEGERLLESARRWGVERPVASIAATLCAYWDVRIPALPPNVAPLSPAELVYGRPDRAARAARARLANYAFMLGQAGEVPGGFSRLVYLVRLLFPAPDKLRLAYKIPPGRALAPYYLRRPFRLAGRVFKGLWALARRPERPRRDRRSELRSD